MAKVFAMIQAHMLSTRLPGKVLLDLNGKSVLYHVYNRCKQAAMVDKVIILTSHHPANDVLVDFCELNGIECFRGSENDVLDRYYEGSKAYPSDIIVRVTSDCPLIEPKLIDYWVENMIKDKVEFIKDEEKLFEGFGVDVFTRTALERMKKCATKTRQTEHVVGYFFDYPGEFKFKSYPLPQELTYLYSKHRLTLDTSSDYELIKLLYDKFNTFEGLVDLKKVMEYLDENRDEANINQHIIKKDYYTES